MAAATTTTTKPKPPPSADDMAAPATESGYASAASASSRSPSPSPPSSSGISLTPLHLAHLNAQLETMHPREILRFARVLFPNLYQSTAFGLTGLVTLDMLSKLDAEEEAAAKDAADDNNTPAPVPLIFLDTLHHFPETYALVDRVRARYPRHPIHVFRPAGVATADEFAARHGPTLYATDAELYDYTAKVEPLQRAYAELRVAALLTGRRRSQGGARGALPVLELDAENGDIVKINPLAAWSFAQVKAYVDEHAVPYNALLDRGYKSVGDWHSTVPVAAGEDERAGRWKDQQKSECGIHNSRSRYAAYLQAQKDKAERGAAQQQQQQQQQQAVAV
jgi:phosphoadenosine phosphosulfate reductase